MFLYQYEAEYFANYTQYRVMKYLWCSVTPVIVLIGTYGNIMVLVVLGKQTRTVSTYVYLVALAVGDEVVLVLSFFQVWTKHVFGVDIHCLHEAICRLYFYLATSASHFSVWLIVAVTMERLLVVFFPLHASTYVSVSRACVAVVSLTGLSFLFNAHFLATLTIKQTNLTGDSGDVTEVYRYCDLQPKYEALLRIPWAWIDACLYSYIPFVCIIIANTLIIFRLRDASRRRKAMTQEMPLTNRQISNDTSPSSKSTRRANYQNNCRQNSSTANRGVQRTIMLLVVSFVFLITTMPILILKTITSKVLSNNSAAWTNGVEHANFVLLDALAHILMFINHSINFFLYCVAGAKFRKDFMRRCPAFCRRRIAHRHDLMSNTRTYTVGKSEYETSVA